MRFQATGLNVASVASQFGFKALSAESFAAKVQNVLTGLDGQQIQITGATITAEEREVRANVEAVEARQGGVRSNIVGIVSFL
jgi:hypothetical protein